MNRLMNKEFFLLLDIILILILIFILYTTIYTFLVKDIISPYKLTFYEYFRVKLSNII